MLPREIVNRQNRTSTFATGCCALQCTSADAAGPPREQRWECDRNGGVPTGGLTLDSDELVSAGEQACAWLDGDNLD